MSEILTDTKKMKLCAAEEILIKKKLEKASQDLDNLINHFPEVGTSRESILQSIRELKKQIDDQANALNQMGTNLFSIANLYEKTENEIIGNAKNVSPAIRELVEKMREIFHDLNDLGTGFQDWFSYGGDPVNLCTGNYIAESVDIRIGGIMPIEFKRYYNSMSSYKKSLGTGWSHSYEISLEKTSDTQIMIHYGDGKHEAFESEDHKYYKNVSKRMDYCLVEEGKIKHYSKDGKIMTFDMDGTLESLKDQNGVGISFLYDNGRLKDITTSIDTSLSFSYDELGYLKDITDHTGRKVSYRVIDHCLVQVVGTDDGIYKFEYDERGRLVKNINPSNVVTLVNEYDEYNRVTKQTFPDESVMEYRYLDDQHKIEFVERNGSVTTYVHDELFRHVETRYADGNEVYELNELGLRTSVTDALSNVTHYTYDDKGNITSKIDPLGNKNCYTYSEDGRLLSMKNALGDQVTYTYDKKGRVIKVDKPMNRTRSMKYNDRGLLEFVILEDGSKESYTYDACGNVISITDARGMITKFAYDLLNRVIRVTDGRNIDTCYEYDNKDRVIKVINGEGQTKSFVFNQSGKLLSYTDFDGTSEHFVYNECNLMVEHTDKEGKKEYIAYDEMWNQNKVWTDHGEYVIYQYDERNRIKTVKNAVGTELVYDYDVNGNVVCQSVSGVEKIKAEYDACNRTTKYVKNGIETNIEYNEIGLVSKIYDALGNATVYEYDSMGGITKVTDPLGNVEQFQYNANGKLESKIDKNGACTRFSYYPGEELLESVTFFDGNQVVYSYDEVGNVLTEKTSAGYEISYEYDKLNRMVLMSSNLGQRKGVSYDAAGHVSSITNGNNDITQYHYSPLGNLLYLIDPLGNKTEYEYDENHFLKATIHASEEVVQKTLYERDLNGRVTKITNPLGDSLCYEYDVWNRIVAIVDEDFNKTEYQYSDSDKLTNVRYSDGRNVRFEYDELQRLSEFKDWIGTTKIKADQLGRAVEVSDPYEKVISYEWGPLNEMKSITYPDGRKVGYEYDQMTRLIKLSEGKNEIEYHYDSFGNISEKICSNGLKSKYKYYKNGAISALCNEDVSGIIDQYLYQYDACGNKTRVEKYRRDLESENGVYDYSYDGAGRLVCVTKDDARKKTYQYDGFGNRSSMCEDDIICKYVYNVRNQLLSQITDFSSLGGSIKTKEYSYDRRGNLVKKTEGDKVKQYQYGATNRLESISENGKELISYSYNGLARKLSEKIEGEEIFYTNDLTRKFNNILQKCIKDDSEDYIYDGCIETVVKSNDSHLFVKHDELGSSVGIYDEAGRSIQQYAYDEFGQDTVTRTGDFLFGFTGYVHDRYSEGYYANARFYDPQNGRFDSADIVKGIMEWPATHNEYTYVTNNPLKYLDEDGEWLHILIGGVVGGVVSGGVTLFNEVKDNGWGGVDWKKVGVHTATGAVEGVVTAVCPVAGFVTTGVLEAGGNVYDQWADSGYSSDFKPDYFQAAEVGVVSGLFAWGSSALCGAVTDFASKNISGYVFSDVNGALNDLWKDAMKSGNIVGSFLKNFGDGCYVASKAFLYDIYNNFITDMMISDLGILNSLFTDWLNDFEFPDLISLR